MRCADLGPTPGRRPSSSMRSWTGPAYMAMAASAAEKAAEPAEAPEGGLVDVVGSDHGVAHCGQHEILQHLDVGGIDHRWVDRDPLELHPAGDLHLDHAAAGLTLDDLLGRLGLRLHELRLHLLGLL